MDMDPRGGFAQKWDRLEDFLVPKPELASESKDSKSENVPYIALKKGDFHYRLGAGDLAQVDKYPKGVLIVPGMTCTIINVPIVLIDLNLLSR